MDPGESKAVVVGFVVLLMIGSVMMFVVGTGLLGNIEDPHKDSHSYSFTGTLDGAACTGDGRTDYTPESTRGYLYTMNLNVRSSEDERSLKIGLLFDSDDQPTSSLYQYIGETEIDGQVVKEWRHVEKEMEYTMYTAECCKVVRILISADGMEVVGDMEG